MRHLFLSSCLVSSIFSYIDVSHSFILVPSLLLLFNLFEDALVEVCALQLQFMQENRDKIRMGMPLTPPVSQNKIEDLMGKILPGEIERFLAKVKEESAMKDRPRSI